MATQVTAKIQQDTDWYLNALEREARRTVDLVMRWNEIEEVKQRDRITEWPLTIDYPLRSLSYQDKGLMSWEQCQHLRAVRNVPHEHASMIEDILGPDDVMLNLPREWNASV